MNEYIAWAVTLVLAYLIGSTPSGVIVTRLWRGVDIRSYGSGSTGTTNVLRTLGPKAAVLVFFLDVAKGAAAVAIAKLLDVPHLAVALAGALVVVGHMWPVFARFRGGKGVATLAAGRSFFIPGRRDRQRHQVRVGWIACRGDDRDGFPGGVDYQRRR